MDEATAEIISRKLRAWEGQPIDNHKLVELRNEISTKTGKNKFAPFSNVKIWIKQVRKTMAKEKKSGSKSKKAGAQEYSVPPMSPVMDKVFLQTISYEIAGIRRAMERVSHQLDQVEKQLYLKRPHE